jgi:hypothetical protein
LENSFKKFKNLINSWHGSSGHCNVIYLFCFAIENTVKQPFSCLQYDSQTVLVLLLSFFAIENTVKQQRLLYHRKMVDFCHWEFSLLLCNFPEIEENSIEINYYKIV